jgi:hypothetical protein
VSAPRIPEHATYGYGVVLFDTSVALPVFHESHARTIRDEGGRGATVVTRCGRWHYRYSQERPAEARGMILDPRHAIKFARPCRRCYRDGAPEPIEELRDNGRA